MKRRAFLAAAAALAARPLDAAVPRFTRGLLWKITRAGAPAGYVYGTIHLPDPRLAEVPPPIRKAFAGARSLMVEFLPDPYTRERFLEAALLPQEQSLRDIIGEEAFERAVKLLEPAGLAADAVDRLKPWSVLLNLRNAGGAQGVPLDGQLVELARARRLPCWQIEGVEEQIFTFDEFPVESQVALLKHSLAHMHELLELSARTLDAYLVGDLAGIWRLREQFVSRYPEMAAHQAVMTKRVVLDRSVVMAFRMQRELRRGHAFVAVGALHLYGEKGVLRLLEQDGYRVSRAA